MFLQKENGGRFAAAKKRHTAILDIGKIFLVFPICNSVTPKDEYQRNKVF